MKMLVKKESCQDGIILYLECNNGRTNLHTE